MSIKRNDLMQHLNELLQPEKCKDYCPNGLQVEGKSEIKKIITGVTASQALIDVAIAENADAIFVHHGYFWRGESECITGIKKKRLQALLAHDINLIAYHLPLDNHPLLGNNVQLAKILDLQIESGLNPNDPSVPGLIGRLPKPMQAAEFYDLLTERLLREPVHLGPNIDSMIETIAWCTGGAQGYMQYAIDAGIDAYLTGEVSEPSYHLAVETDTHFFSAGHHATERYGAKAVGEHLREAFDIDVVFKDIDNPV
jgi:dinuclear metal center YbgI/SA1388 family protein